MNHIENPIQTFEDGVYEMCWEFYEHSNGFPRGPFILYHLELIKMNLPIYQRSAHRHFLYKVMYLMELFVVTMVPDTVHSNLILDTSYK